MSSYGYTHSSSRRKRSSRRNSDAPKLYTAEESARILEASREALRRRGRYPQASERGYYAFPRSVAPVIPPYEDFLAQARARVNYGDADRVNPGPTAYQTFRPDPYLYGYPSGYYDTEIRAPLSHHNSGRSRKTDRSSTLVGTESRRSSTVVDSNRTSYHSGRDSYPPRRSGRVHWGPNYVLAEPPMVSTHFPNNPSQPLPRLDNPFHTRTRRHSSPDHSLHSTSDAEGVDEDIYTEENSEYSNYPTRSLNLSPSRFIEHEFYLIRNSATLDHNAQRESESRARQEELYRELSAGGAVSRWSPETVRRERLLNRFSGLMRGLMGKTRRRTSG